MHILHLERLSADIKCTPPSLDGADVAVGGCNLLGLELAARPMRPKLSKPAARLLLGAALPRKSGAKLRRTRQVSAPVVGGHSLATGHLQHANDRAEQMIQWLEGDSEIAVGGKSKIERPCTRANE
ncbi:hypothetical protein AnigIFM49718_005186 [Aspergillus niger]|nr:hypothetical protein AnigIFM49718_005186 [Aspergillus niger]